MVGGFTVPALLWIRETPAAPLAPGTDSSVLTRGFRQFLATFREIRRDQRLLFFLTGYILYIDA